MTSDVERCGTVIGNPAGGGRGETRERLLQAAAALAREVGPGNLSLDAVAARAGVSKGGLLYHFPTKARLLEALVGGFLSEMDAALQAAEAEDRPNGVAAAYLATLARHRRANDGPERRQACPPTSGLLAALAEDPELLDPVRAHDCDFLARIRANATDPDLATLVFLVAHGIRNLDLLAIPALRRGEIEAVLDYLAARLESGEAARQRGTQAR